jgi:hypothetical protein
MSRSKRSLWRVAVLVVISGGCANDPLFVPSPMNLEAGQQDMQGNMVVSAAGSLLLPIKVETQKEMQAQAALSQKLGVKVPYVQCDTIAVEVDWTIKNLDGSNAGTAVIELNGANEFFSYVPSTINLDPGAEEAPPTPDLQGNIPINVPAGGSVDGLFREDQMLEASVDLDEITRGNVNPFAATLSKDQRDITSFQPMTALTFDAMGNPLPQTALGNPIPRAAIPFMIRVDLIFKPSTHMVLDWDVRMRDLNGNMLDDRGASAPTSALQQFNNIMQYTVGSGSGSGG